ncbi:MAG: glycosyltransferase family 39 protein [Anaerolineales bacterium]|nr:glycosyltransferase family 39 protein [Anaerolineales bacterium]
MKEHRPEKDSANDKIHRFVTFLSISLVILGQIYLFATPPNENIIIPKPLWLCIAGVIIFIANLAFKPGKAIQKLFSRIPISGTTAWIITSIVAAFMAIISAHAFTQANRANFIPVISFWFMSACCYLAAFMDFSEFIEKTRIYLKDHKQELIQLGLITLFAAILRLYRLGTIPAVLNGDEGWMGLTAISSGTNIMANPFHLWENFGVIYLQAVNFCITLFGPTPFALRVVPTIAGILGIPAIYFLARYIGGHRIGLLSAVFLSFSHAHLHFSRSVSVGYIQGTWLVPLELYFFLSAVQKRSSWRAALGGALLAFHFYIYLSAQIVIGLLIIYMIISFFLFRSWLKPAFKQLLVFWGGFIVIVLPELEYAVVHPGDFFSRLNMDGTFQSGWLQETMLSTGQSAVLILAKRVIHAFLSLNFYPASDFYGSPIPILTLISSALFWIGLALILWRVFSPNFLLLNGYFWGFTVAVGVFALPPSADAYRMLAALPPALIISAYALDQILEMMGVGWRHSPPKYITITSVVMISLIIFNLWTYFFDFAGQCKYGSDTQTRFASYLGQYAAEVDKEPSLFLLSDDVFSYGTHLTVDFLSQKREIINVNESIDMIDMISGDIIVASPNRIQELHDWVRINPGGVLFHKYDCDKIILASYRVP